MIHCAEIKRVASYQDVISHMCGRFFGIVCQVCITMGGFGACVAILILIGDQLVDSMLYMATQFIKYEKPGLRICMMEYHITIVDKLSSGI